MATFLLTWNPNNYHWESLAADAKGVRIGETAEEQDWSVGVRKSGIGSGDRYFMLRQGPEPRGIMGSGSIDSEVWREQRWTGEGKANYVDITFDALVDPDEEPDRIIPIRELIERFEGRFYFMRVQGSGQKLPDDVAEELEQMWDERVGERSSVSEEDDEDGDDGEEEEDDDDDFEPLTEQLDDDKLYAEGAVREVSVNAHERSAAARQACIEHWGTRCCVCDFDFEAVYGELGAGFIEVHHLVALAEVDEEYEVDPINDLRPVCPNCHAMIHRQEPALSINALQRIARRGGAKTR